MCVCVCMCVYVFIFTAFTINPHQSLSLIFCPLFPVCSFIKLQPLLAAQNSTPSCTLTLCLEI